MLGRPLPAIQCAHTLCLAGHRRPQPRRHRFKRPKPFSAPVSISGCGPAVSSATLRATAMVWASWVADVDEDIGFLDNQWQIWDEALEQECDHGQHLMTSRYRNGTREPRDWTISVTSRVRTEAEPGSLSRFESACALTKFALL